jgi:Fur family peroxide stress response transcriptional regulator
MSVRDDFISISRSKRLSVTPQRIAVYEALQASHSHPSPEQIHAKVRKYHPAISLATVYNILEKFRKNDLVRAVNPMLGKLRYDPITDRHHHAICMECGKIEDIFNQELNDITLPETLASKYKLEDFSVHFNVLCTACQNNQQTK